MDLSLQGLGPHSFTALTLMVPPLEPVFTLIEFVEELPLHPEGSCH